MERDAGGAPHAVCRRCGKNEDQRRAPRAHVLLPERRLASTHAEGCRLCSPEEGTERADGTGKAENQNVRRRRTGAGLERGARPVPRAAPGSFPGTPGWISGHPHGICHGRRSSSPPPGPRDCRLRTGSSLLQGPRPGLPSLHPDSSRRPQLCPHPQPRPRQPPARATASWRVSLLCPTRCVLYRTPKASLEPAVSPVTP